MRFAPLYDAVTIRLRADRGAVDCQVLAVEPNKTCLTRPLPPGESKSEDTRYLDIHEDDQLDEELVASWIRQASELPGWVP